MEKAIFLFLSLISGCIEMGGVIYGISIKLSVIQIVGLALAYQIGNLVPNPLKINKNVTILTSILSFCCFFYCKFINVEYFVLALGYVFIAMTIQSIRSLQKNKVSTSIKRSFRILGFLIAPFIGVTQNVIISAILILIVLYTRFPYKDMEFKKVNFKFLNGIMVVHQMHYFSYVYFAFIAISLLIGEMNLKILGVIIMLGWVTYTSVAHFLVKERYYKYFICGHLTLTVILFLLALNTGNMWSILLWVMTGFGGGTVFCIGKIRDETNECSKDDIVFSENIGHIMGVISGIIIYYLTNDLAAPVYLSSAYALTACTLMIIHSKKATVK